MLQNETTKDAVVIGGGLGGLTAAIYLAKAGCSVTLLEKADQPGGRASTLERGSALLNLGAHALYKGGAAARILQDLGCMPEGGTPPQKGYGIRNGKLLRLPATPASMLNRDLPWADKMEIVRLIARLLPKLDPQQYAGASFKEWVDRTVSHPLAREFVLGIVRVGTFCAAIDVQDAGAVLRQMQHAMKGVLYVHGGWRTITARLADVARRAGVEFRQVAAECVEAESGRVSRVRLAEGGGTISARAVVIAAGPDEVCRLVPGEARASAESWRNRAEPVRVASLDLVLKRLAFPERKFAIGFDCPLYFSNHSAIARLSGDDTMVVHTLKYMDGTETDPQQDEAELERMMDLVQPGWREDVVYRRYMPRLTVVHDARSARNKGAGAAPHGSVSEVRGLYIAGDWVGPEGMLSDASFASGRQAALDAAHVIRQGFDHKSA